MRIEETRGVLLLDGATGTMLQQMNLAEDDLRGERFRGHSVPIGKNFDILNLTRPDIIAGLHQEYLRAGADIITTNTICSQPSSQSRFGLREYAAEMNFAAATIARSMADEFTFKTGRQRFVAGSVGPTYMLLASISDNQLRAEARSVLVDDYALQMQALVSGGVDALLIETAVDPINALAALEAAEKVAANINRKPALMLSIPVADESCHLYSGMDVGEYVEMIPVDRLFSIGFNCGCGAAVLRRPLERLAAMAKCRISVCPNAESDERIEDFTTTVGEYIREGLCTIAGGCCGTTPAHISALRRAIDRL